MNPDKRVQLLIFLRVSQLRQHWVLHWGRRIPFLTIATLGIVAWILNRVALPKQARKNVEISSIADQVKLILHPHVLLTLLITILGYGGTFATFTYLSSIL